MNSTVQGLRVKSLRSLLAGLTAVVPPDIEILDLTLDSRQVRPGTAFIALPGLRTHGVGYAAQAANAGAAVILWEPTPNIVAPNVMRAPLVAVPQLSALLGAIADRFFDAPCESISVAGITGTNGKTTTAYVLAMALEHLGSAAAYAGTLGSGRINALRTATHTTPDCITVHRELADFRDEHLRYLGMEVSSHALDQHRIDAVRIETAVFTNLTRDHLDYHGTLEAYAAAKAQLFAWPGLRHAVINGDDAFGRELIARHTQSAELTVCSRAVVDRAALPASARHIIARTVGATPRGLKIELETSWGNAMLNSRFIGDFNVDNLMAVLGVLLVWQFSLPRAIAALEECVAPPGRMETFTSPGRATVIVDYAHTPDALEKALLAVRKHCAGKLVCVFGCGGDRDPGKRPMMGAIAERLADSVVITDDNPRGENGDVIVANILAGLAQPAAATVQRDRANAIELALNSAHAGDAVLIAGKGHEDYQVIAGETRHFSDREVVQAALGRQP
jgi:UDP-N-acetylmuramoyl-L-alanyl-D-glutamate--2,6-diaminopimelate ligase